MKILRIDLYPQKLVPAEKNTRKIKHRKNQLPSVKLKTPLLIDLCHWGDIDDFPLEKETRA